MRLLTLATVAAALTLRAQAPQRPAWLEVFDKARPAPGQSNVPLGTYDAEVEGAWAAALTAGPANPYFASAAQKSADYFLGQGYTSKAEAILRQAIALDPKATWLTISLAQQLQQEQRLLAAAALLQDFLSRPRTASDRQALETRTSTILQLANVREQLGEFDRVEPLLREARALRPPHSFEVGIRPEPDRLAEFYLRRGDVTKAEAELQQLIRDANSMQESFQGHRRYSRFLDDQKRSSETPALWEKLLQTSSLKPEGKAYLSAIRDNLIRSLQLAGQQQKALEVARQGDQDSQHAANLADRSRAEILMAQNRQNVTPPDPPVAVPSASLLDRAREHLNHSQFQEAFPLLEQALAEAAPQVQENPEGAAITFRSIIAAFPYEHRDRQQQFAAAFLSLLDKVAPANHPRLAAAIGEFLKFLPDSAFSPAVFAHTVNRQEKILAAAKGEDSPALNDVSRLRARYLTGSGEHEEALAEMRNALQRTQGVAGRTGEPTLQVMRTMIEFLQFSKKNWPEEEALRLRLIEFGSRAEETHIRDMKSLAARYASFEQQDKAVVWIDKAIEVATKNPQLAHYLPDLQQTRTNFVRFGLVP